MNPAQFKLIIHHHDIAYLDADEQIWLTAGIGRWVCALADHFAEVGLLLHESPEPLPRQDTSISRENVKLYSFGPPGHYWDHLPRLKRIRHVCSQMRYQADGLLIRGLTPRQHTVWENTPVPRKAFLLIRSPKQQRLVKLTPTNMLSALINRYREYEFGKIVKKDTLLLVNSPTHIAEVERLFGNRPYFVPTNTILEAEFAPFQVRSISPPFKLLFCGRLNFLKGLRELFHAISVLQQQGQNCSLDLVAAKTEPVFSQLQDLAHQLGIAEYINWQGYVPYGPELFKFYLNADVFVLPTYTEGFPRVLWEAAANCCPVVTTHVGGIPALWENEKHALLIPPKDTSALVGALQRLFTDQDLRERLVTSAYMHAKMYTLEACSRSLVDILSAAWK